MSALPGAENGLNKLASGLQSTLNVYTPYYVHKTSRRFVLDSGASSQDKRRDRGDIDGSLRSRKTAGLRGAPKDTPLFRSAIKKTRILTAHAIRVNDVCRMVKRRLKNAELSNRLSPHSFPGDDDHEFAGARRSTRGCAAAHRTRGSTHHPALRSAAEKKSREILSREFQFEGNA
jgi:hypothetical protein